MALWPPGYFMHLHRFWDKVNKNSGVFGIDGQYSTECWEWIGYISPKGYGEFWFFDGSKRIYRAHKVSWIIHYGPIDKQVLHKCDNKKCIRPDHLFSGDHADNMRDMKNKGRANGGAPMGLQNGSTKLTKEKVKKMRRLKASGLTYRQIANQFGIGLTTAWAAITKRTWSQI